MLGLLAAILASGGCLKNTAAFACTSDADCGTGGHCEPVGFCSFADPGCDQGRRYGDLSGPYANQCVGFQLDAGRPDGIVGTRRRKSVTIGPVGVDLADFPVWISITDPDLRTHGFTDGSDIFFTGASDQPLDHEVQRWDMSAARLDAWVRVPLLSGTAPTVIWLRYGDPSTARLPDPAGVFGAGFAAVWHLDDALAGSSTVADARGAHAGTAIGGLGSAGQVPAQLGGGLDFDGTTNEVAFTNPLLGSGPHTISVWVDQRATTDTEALVVLGDSSCGHARWLHGHYGTIANVATGFFCADWTTSGVDVTAAGWKLIHWVYDGAGVGRLYRDGQLAAGPFTYTGAPLTTTGTGGHLGNAPAAYGTNVGAKATLDEVRIATVARSPEWIAAEFANQSAPATFYAIGPEQLVP
jgi:biopolymer transport protein ExbB